MNSEFTPELQSDLLDDFYAECDDHLKQIREFLVQLDASVGKAQCDAQLLDSLFRHFHSFKGISAIVGLTAAEQLAHAAEELLRELSKGAMSLSAQALEALMTASQRLEQLVVAFRRQVELPDHQSLQDELLRLSARNTAAPGLAPPRPQSGARVAPLSNACEEARAQGRVLWKCVYIPCPALDARGINVNTTRQRLASTGEILSSKPLIRAGGEIEFEFVVAMRETPSDIAQWESEGIVSQLLDQEPTSLPSSDSQPAAGALNQTDASQSPFVAPSHIVRVDLNRLDDLMRITGELVIARSKFDEQINTAVRSSGSLEIRSAQEINSALGRSLRELRQAIMRVRLVPIAEIFARMPFVVRDLARDSDKKVRLNLSGQQTEIDKYVVERLKDPLLHLVRNAFSHGVETPAERSAVGKLPEGTIALRATSLGDSVLIQVQDDGRGVDAESVGRRARSLGLKLPAVLDNAGLLEVLCSAGFSTKEEVDRASGRGVGMAVALNTVRELGGSMSLETELGRGTRFTLRLPLTVAIAETLIVSAAGQTCAIAQSFVSEVLQINTAELRMINQVEVIPYRGGVLPVIRLASLFRFQPADRPKSFLLVLSSERGQTGLLVDQLHGQKEVVVRALRDPLIQVDGITGATELGDGRPVLILDGAMLTAGAAMPHTTRHTTNGLAPSATWNDALV